MNEKLLQLLIVLIVSNKAISVKVSTTGYHIVHNEHEGNGFLGYKYQSSPLPIPSPLTGYYKL